MFNAKLFMRRNVRAEEDSVVSMLQIKNPMPKRYFEFQLGRMYAVPLEKVRMYENGISKKELGVCKDYLLCQILCQLIVLLCQM